MQWVQRYLLLPGVQLYVLFLLLDHLSKDDRLSHLAELVRTVIEWVMKSMTAAAIGFQVIQGLILPAVDGLKNTAVSRTVSAIPGIGNLFGSVTDTVLGSAVLLKNAVGVCGMIAVLMLCLAPVCRLAFCTLIYKAMAFSAAGRRQTAQRMCGGSCRRSRAASEDHDVLQYAVFPDDRHCHRIAWKIEERGEKMSAEIRSWVRSILCCLCLMQLAEQILPDNHYQKYIRLFCGVLFLILLISPLTDQAHLTAVFEKQWQQALQLEEWDSIRMEQENLSDLRSRVLTEACQKEVQRQIEETADGEGMKGTKAKVVFQSEETEGIRKVTISGGMRICSKKRRCRSRFYRNSGKFIRSAAIKWSFGGMSRMKQWLDFWEKCKGKGQSGADRSSCRTFASGDHLAG